MTSKNTTLPGFTHQRIDTRAGARSAFDTALESAQRLVRIFDRDGVFYGFERAEVAQRIDALARRSRDARLQIVLQHTRHVRERCPRLLEAMRHHGGRIEIHRLADEMRPFERGFVLVDDAVVLRRPHFDRSVTYWDVDEQEIAAAGRLFEELLGYSASRMDVNVTGL